MVPRIQDLGAILHLQPLLDLEILDRREIPARLAIRPDSTEPKRREADVARQLLRRVLVESGIGVEPSVHVALVFWQVHIVRISGEQRPDVAKAQRRAALPLYQ